jgi:tellurite resistance protein
MTQPDQSASPSITAACGAYLVIALADARVASIEEARFLGGVVNDPAFRQFAPNALADEYTRLLAGLQADWTTTEAEILGAISAIGGDPQAVAAVKVAARQAIIADQILKPQEDFVLARIARALGLEPEAL